MRLLEFPHSHFCEKARWALDYKGIPFEPVAILPGLHMITVRRYVPDTSVPVLLDGPKAMQGSSEIIDYLERKQPARPLTPGDPDERRACLEIEQAMDVRLGETLRQVLYNRLLAYPDFIRHCFTHPMPRFKQLLFSLTYPVLRRKIYQSYVISDARVARGRREFDTAMAELAKRLEGKSYLVGDRFTRADLSVASMLCWLVMPPEHPFPWKDIPDPVTRTFCAGYRDHPVSEWVRTMYRDHRLAGGTISESQ